MKTDVVIIGGGVTGIVTALACIQYGLRVLILERNTRLGGRIQTIYQGKSQYEAGAGRISSNHLRTLKLLQAFGLTLVKIRDVKEYRENGVIKNVHIENWIKYIIEQSKIYNQQTLQNVSFGFLAEYLLGVEKAYLLQQAFGYNAEFESINAWDGIEMFRNDFLNKHDYFWCKEGLSEWIARMEKALINSSMVTILTGHSVTDWFKTKLGFGIVAKNIQGNSVKFLGRSVVCTLPKDDLLQLPKWTIEQRSLFNAVESIPLHRIYGKFPVHKDGTTWFQDIPRTTTHDEIRQFIPQSNGVAMMSYTDMEDANFWNQYKNQGELYLRKALLTHMHVVFPEIQHIPTPRWVNSHYWSAGVHMWKTGVNSEQIHNIIKQPLGVHVPWFIAGETYSLHQAWIEGALEMVDEIIPSLIQMTIKSISGGNGISKGNEKFKTWADVKKIGKINASDLEILRQRFSNKLWVIMDDPLAIKPTKILLDVTEWKDIHPGGSYMFKDNAYKDITQLFQSTYGHKEAGKLSSIVLKKVKELTVAKILL